jgi:hypothetical protein
MYVIVTGFFDGKPGPTRPGYAQKVPLRRAASQLTIILKIVQACICNFQMINITYDKKAVYVEVIPG